MFRIFMEGPESGRRVRMVVVGWRVPLYLGWDGRPRDDVAVAGAGVAPAVIGGRRNVVYVSLKSGPRSGYTVV